MKKNVASQLIGAQMTTAADGTAFTGTATVVITIDGGTQSASGGTGPTHEGNGYHTYIPTQAETNGGIIAFTFTGAGAITTTVQVFTTFPQTGDSYVAIGTDGTGLTEAGGTGDQLTAINLPNQTMDIVGDITGNLSGTVGSVTTKTDYALSTAGILAIWHQALTAVVTAGSVGKLLKDEITAARMAVLTDWIDAGRLDAILDIIATDTTTDIPALIATAQNDLNIITGASGVNLLTATQASIDAIEADTNELQVDWTDAGRLDALLDAIKVITDALGATAAANLALSCGAAGIIAGAATGTPTTTAMAASALTEATNDHYKGRVIIWTSGALLGQAAAITGYTGATKTFAFAATTEACVATDAFLIV